MATRCMGSPGDHVIAPFPAYQSLYANLTSIGCTVDKWEPEFVEEVREEVEEENGQENERRKIIQGVWRFSVSSLRKLIKPETKMLVVNFPHNPTGAVLSPKEWEELISFCRARKIVLFSDEMYQYLKDDGVDRKDNGSLSSTHTSACVLYDGATTLCGLSKSFSLPGLRIGWLATRNLALMEKLKSLKDYLSICSSAPSEVLALIAVRCGTFC